MVFQTLETFDTFRQDPDYQEALQNFQRGSWKTGLTQLNALMEKYPLEHELRQLARRCCCAPRSIAMRPPTESSPASAG